MRVFCILATLALPAAGAGLLDPAQTVGPETCKACHAAEFQLWQTTAHAKIFDSPEPLHQRPRAKEIAGKMGFALIKHDSRCLDCHYTPKILSGRVTARAGVSCESCHGAAQNWVHVHNNFGGRQVERKSETPETRRAREARNVAAGMLSSANLADLVARCYACHVVDDERLVGVGGHTAGGGFDLLERLEKVRHNFVRGERTVNAPFPPEEKRRLFVLSTLLELEADLRSLTHSSPESATGKLRARDAKRLSRTLERLREAAPVPPLATARAAVEGLAFEPGAAELDRAADSVRAAARGFASEIDGTQLAALDSLMSGGAAETVSETPAESAIETAAVLTEPTAAVTSTATSTTPGSPTAAKPAAPKIAGQIRDRLREPLSPRRVVGPGRCTSCHERASGWWLDDPHSRAAEPFLDRQLKQRQIALHYYGRAADDRLATGRSVCMDCHGTVVTGKEGQEVEDGVGCEACHGPAGDYLERHPKIAHAERVTLGMVERSDLDRRAQICASCHDVTDARLLASGHPSGRSFDPAARLKKIEHWAGGQPEAGRWRAAYAKVQTARGPLPAVAVAALDPGPAETTTTAAPADFSGPTAGAPASARSAISTRAEPSSSAPTETASVEGSSEEIVEDVPLDELLIQIKNRLERLDVESGGGG